MEFTEIEVGLKKTVVFDDLTIVNLNGGHEIEMDGHDEPFAEMSFKTPRAEELKRNLYRPLKGPDNLEVLETFVYDTYTIRIKDVTWNGEMVTLLIGKGA